MRFSCERTDLVRISASDQGEQETEWEGKW